MCSLIKFVVYGRVSVLLSHSELSKLGVEENVWCISDTCHLIEQTGEQKGAQIAYQGLSQDDDREPSEEVSPVLETYITRMTYF